MFTKHFVIKPLAVAILALFFVFTGAERLVFVPDSELIDIAEADDDKDKDKDDDDKDKDKDKDKDDDSDCDVDHDGFCYKKNQWSVSSACSNISKLQIAYHKAFISTEDAGGPNILVEGTDRSGCKITIEKISGGNRCGFKVIETGGVLKIDTKPKGNANNCEMCIKVVVPRTVKIRG